MKNTIEVQDWIIQLGLKFWQAHDFVFNDNKTEIFRCLYVESSCRSYTSVKLCFILHISESTLLRYKKLFNRSIQYFCASTFSKEAV